MREGGTVAQVDEAQGGGGEFQTATPDGSVAFYTKAGHLYRYDAATHTATDLTPSGGVKGVLGASEDGSTVYYPGPPPASRNGTKAPPPSRPRRRSRPAERLPAHHRHRPRLPRRSRLLFLSTESLTDYDNHDAATGQPDSEVFLWNATGGGLPASPATPPASARSAPRRSPAPIANGAAPGSTDSYKPRNLSATAGPRLL